MGKKKKYTRELQQLQQIRQELLQRQERIVYVCRVEEFVDGLMAWLKTQEVPEHIVVAGLINLLRAMQPDDPKIVKKMCDYFQGKMDHELEQDDF